VPVKPVFVDIVQDGQAGFWSPVYSQLCIIRLGSLVVSGVAPGLIRPILRLGIGWGHLGSGSGPEPSINRDGLKILSIPTSLEIAKSPRAPNVLESIVPDEVKHDIVLLLRLNGHGVHAILTTSISRLEPVHLSISILGHIPRVKVPVTIVEKLFGTTTALDWIREREKPGLLILAAALGRGGPL